MGSEQIECTFLWTIKNYSYCWYKNSTGLFSPHFPADGMEKTTWRIGLFTRGTHGNKGYVSFFIFRPETDDGPEEVSIRFELSLLAVDGSPLAELKGDGVFKRKSGIGDEKFLKMHRILLLRKDDYLPQDTLTVLCKIWKGVGDILRVAPVFANTLIEIRKICFLLEVESFNTLKENQKHSIEFQYHSQEETLVKCNLYITQYLSSEGKVVVEINSIHNKYVLSKVKLFLLASNNIILCGGDDNRHDFERKDISKLPLSLTRKDILDKKSEYLPDGKLSLLCKCVFSTGQKIEDILHEMPVYAEKMVGTQWKITLNTDKREETQLETTLDPEKMEGAEREMPEDSEEIEGSQSKITFNAEKREGTLREIPIDAEKEDTLCIMPVDSEKVKETQPELPVNYSIQTNTQTLIKNHVNTTKGFSARSSVSEDLKEAYINKCLTDIEIKTKTKSFSVHKIVLFVRSPVFKAMVTNDTTDYIHVDDLEDEVVDRFLLFLYSDTVGNLDYKLATRLYYAAHKYQVDALKEVCSNFLVESLTPNRAGGLLLFSHHHADSHLKKAVEDFLIEHETEVFGSDEWEALMETNPTLVMKAMHLKYKRGKRN